MVHSIWDQDLLPNAVVGQRLRLAKSQGLLAFLGAADHAQRGHVAVGHDRINGGGGVADVSGPDFLIWRIDRDADGVAQTGVWAANGARGRDVALVSAMKNDDVLAHVVGDIEVAGIRIDGHGAGPIQARFGTLDDAQRSLIAIGVQPVHGDGGRAEAAGAGHRVIGDIAPVIHEQKLPLGIDGHAVRIGKLSLIADQQALGLLVAGCAFAVNRNLGRMLHRDEELLVFFIHGHGVGTVCDTQLANRLGVTGGVVLEGDNHVPDVVFHGVHIAIRWVDIDAAIELHLGVIAHDDAARFGGGSAGLGVVEPAKNADAPQIVVLQKDFIALVVNSHGTVDRGGIAQHADGRPIDIDTGPVLGLDSRFSKIGKKIVGGAGHAASFEADGAITFRGIGNLVNRYEPRRAVEPLP